MSSSKKEQQAIYQQIGHLTRTLHDSLRDIQGGSELTHAVEAIPDTKERLAYVLSMTEQAVSRVLNAVDGMSPLNEQTRQEARQWLRDCEHIGGDPQDIARLKQFLLALDERGEQIKDHLLDVVMAQEFQDLTGQVIKRIVDVASSMESELLALLQRTQPEDKKQSKQDPLLNGPAMQSSIRDKQALHSQQEVDKFLDDLGF